MSLEKSISISKVEFVGIHKTLCVQKAISVIEDGNTISKSFTRESYDPQNILELPSELQPYAQGVWTDELISEFNEYVLSTQSISEEQEA